MDPLSKNTIACLRLGRHDCVSKGYRTRTKIPKYSCWWVSIDNSYLLMILQMKKKSEITDIYGNSIRIQEFDI